MKAPFLSVVFGTLALLNLIGIAHADLIGPNEESCLRKRAGDVCADVRGAAGVCKEETNARGRTRLRCMESVISSVNTTTAPTKGSCMACSSPPDMDGSTCLTVVIASMAVTRTRKKRVWGFKA